MKNYHLWPAISSCLKNIEDEKTKLTKASINLDTLTQVREDIHKQVEELQLCFEQDLDKQFASLCIFAIAAYIDETMQRRILDLGEGNWLPLQKDFYGAYNAGELFYETIDKIIDDPQLPPIVPQVFYFIMKKGFQGKYRDSKSQITKCLDLLKEKIPMTEQKSESKHEQTLPSRLNKKIKPWHYYAGAGCLTFCLLVVLYITSSIG